VEVMVTAVGIHIQSWVSACGPLKKILERKCPLRRFRRTPCGRHSEDTRGGAFANPIEFEGNACVHLVS
jgi:hypothetical protein